MHHVFISYSRRDAAWALDLRALLEEQAVRTWLDQRDIPVSVPWLAEVTEAIEDAALFLVCDSPHWTASVPCRAEDDVADRIGTPKIVVDVGAKAGAVATKVIASTKAVSAVSYPLRELHAQAREWDRNGRAARLLASKAQRVRAAGCADRAGSLEKAFLAASARRAARRTTLLVGGVLVTVVTALAGSLLFAVRSRVDEGNAAQAAAYQRVVDARAEVAKDPYFGLRMARSLGGNESAMHADLLEGVLATPVPDDAFDVAATRFAQTPIGDDVVVEDGRGGRWSRLKNVRTATPSAAVVNRAPLPYGIELDGEVVVITRRGALYRKVQVPGARRTFAVSPDGRWLAVGENTAVSVVDIEAGTVRRRLVGAPGAVSDLAWSADGTRVWAVTGTKVVSWRWTTGRLLVNEPGQWFQAVLPADNTEHVWLVTRGGELRLISLRDGETTRVIKTDDSTVIAAGGNGRIAVLMGFDHNSLVNLADGTLRRFELPEDCSKRAGGVSVNADSVAIPCKGKDVQIVSLAEGRVTRAVQVQGRGAGAATITDRGNVVVGGLDGEVFWSDKDSTTSRTLLTNVCGVSMNAILLPTKENRIAPIGDGAAQIGCGWIARSVDGEWEWNTNVVGAPSENRHPSISLAALSGAFAPAGEGFVVGFADGSLVMQPSDNLAPSRIIRDVVGGVRSVLFVGDTLYVASREGVLQAIPWCGGCLTNASLAREAAAMADRAAALGLG